MAFCHLPCIYTTSVDSILAALKIVRHAAPLAAALPLFRAYCKATKMRGTCSGNNVPARVN